MSLPKELQELQDKRAKLEDESLSLKEQQEKLYEKTRALEERIMEELKNKNEETRQNITSLESRINELEQRLEKITQKTSTMESVAQTPPQPPSHETSEGVTAEINPAVLEESAEESAEVPLVEDASTTVEEVDSESHQGSEKKKRKFL